MAHEIMENDGMFSVIETPWHGLGKILDSPPTIAEGLIAAGLNWTVTPRPLYARVPVGDYLRATPVDYQAIQRDDTGEILGVVGPSYIPLQNSEAFDVFGPLVEDGSITLETAGSLKNGRRVWVLAKIAADSADIGKGDEIKPFVLLSTSHDGTMAARLGFTPIRVVCNNTLSYAETEGVSKLVRVFHRGDITGALTALRATLDLTKATFTASIEKYRYLASKEISVADLERYVKITFMPEFEEELKNAQEIGEAKEFLLTPTQRKVVDLFENGRGSNLPKARTWWGAYNSINEWLNYMKGRDQDNRLNGLWFGDGYNFNKAALDNAIRMAA